MNMRPYIGDESGIQLVPEPSRLIGSARSMVECIDIPSAPVVRSGASVVAVLTMRRAISASAKMVESTLSVGRLLAIHGVGRLLAIYRSSAFLFFKWHEFHSAFRTISRMISYDFGMHQAGVLLHLLLLLLACRAGGRRARGGCSHLRAIGVP